MDQLLKFVTLTLFLQNAHLLVSQTDNPEEEVLVSSTSTAVTTSAHMITGTHSPLTKKMNTPISVSTVNKSPMYKSSSVRKTSTTRTVTTPAQIPVNPTNESIGVAAISSQSIKITANNFTGVTAFEIIYQHKRLNLTEENPSQLLNTSEDGSKFEFIIRSTGQDGMHSSKNLSMCAYTFPRNPSTNDFNIEAVSSKAIKISANNFTGVMRYEIIYEDKPISLTKKDPVTLHTAVDGSKLEFLVRSLGQDGKRSLLNISMEALCLPRDPSANDFVIEAVSSKAIKISANNFSGVTNYEIIYENNSFNLTKDKSVTLSTSADGSKLTFIVSSIGEDGKTSSRNLSMDAFTLPQDPKREDINVYPVSSRTINVTVNFSEGQQQYIISYDNDTTNLTRSRTSALLQFTHQRKEVFLNISTVGNEALRSKNRIRITAYPLPPDPEETYINIQALSSKTLNITVKFTTGIMRYEINYDRGHLELNREHQSGTIETESEGEKVHLLISTFNYRNKSCKNKLELDSFTRPADLSCDEFLNITKTTHSTFILITEMDKNIKTEMQRYLYLSLNVSNEEDEESVLTQNKTILLSDLNPATLYKLTYAYVIMKKESILTRSSKLCELRKYTKAYPSCERLHYTGTEINKTYFVVVELGQGHVDNIRSFHVDIVNASKPIKKFIKKSMVIQKEDLGVIKIPVQRGSDWNISVQPMINGTVWSDRTCFTNISAAPGNPNCSSAFISKWTSTGMNFDFSQISARGATKYLMSMKPQPQSEQEKLDIRSIAPGKYLTLIHLASGTKYDFNVSSVGSNSLVSVCHCNFSQYTKPKDPDCSKISSSSLSDSIFLNLSQMNLIDNKAHGVQNVIIYNKDAYYNFTELSPGQNFSFTVNSIGHDNQTSDKNCTYSAITRPQAPLCNVSLNISEAMLSLFFVGEVPKSIRRYRVMLKPQPKNYPVTDIFPNSTLNIGMLTPGNQYNLTWKSLGLDDLESTEVCSYVFYSRPAQPQKIQKNVTTSAIILVWNVVGNASSFTIDYNCTCFSECTETIPNAVNNTVIVPGANITGLSPGSECNISIIAHSGDQDSNSLKITKIRTLETAPGLVRNITVFTSSRNVTIEWERPRNPNGIIRNYTVTINTTKDKMMVKTSITDAQNGSFTGLIPGTCYIISIAASTYVGYGKDSTADFYTDEEAPGKMNNLMTTNMSSKSIRVSWVKPPQPNGVIIFYIIYIRRNMSNESECDQAIMLQCKDCSQPCPEAIYSTNQDYVEPFMKKCSSYHNKTFTSHTVEFNQTFDGLVPYTAYEIEGYAATKKGLGSIEKRNQNTSEDVPSPILNIALDPNIYDIKTTMDRPEFPNGVITRYEIEYTPKNRTKDCNKFNNTFKELLEPKAVNITDLTELEGDILSKDIPGLLPYWLYTFRGRSYTSAGHSNWSEPKTARTLPFDPDLVTNITIGNVTSKSISMSWDAPCFTNGIIKQYHVQTVEKADSWKSTDGNNTMITIDDLQPFQNYSFKIFAETIGKTGGISSTGKSSYITQTLCTVPYPPRNAKQVATTANSISLQWLQPEKRTCLTNYTVTATDIRNTSLMFNCSTKGFNNDNCTVINLDEYWEYDINIRSITVNGSAETDMDLKIRTQEAAPGKVTHLEVVPERNVTLNRTMTVTWKEPLERDKNGIIRFYYIIYTDKESGIHSTIRVDNNTFKKRIPVDGGRNYLVKVLACTILNATLAANRTTFVTNGAPIFNFGGNGDTVKQFAIEETVQRSPDDDEKQFVVALPVEKLCDNRNGEIIERGIIVSDTKSISGNVNNFFGERSLYESTKNKNYKTWQEVHEMDNMSPYIATTKLDKLCSKAKRRKRDATETTNTITNVLIGEERDCKGTTEKYCNGYLKPGKEYKVRMYLCTDAGCTETPYFGPFKTEPNNVPLIAGSVSGVLAGIIAVITIVMIIWWRRRRMKKKTEGSSGEDNFAFDGEAMKHLHKTSKTNIHKAAFARHVEEMHADSNLNFAKEYKNIKDNSPSHCTNAAEQQSTRMKNRYTNILAYDHSRVKLLPTEDEEGSDYINANYIPGFNSPREYIATQGPQTCTKDDFWRMIWEQNVSVIVMLTQLVERGRRKCDQYWPDNAREPVFFGDLIVEIESESSMNDYILRVFSMKLGNKVRRAKQFHFLKWPDMGCPDTTWLILKFSQTVRLYGPKMNPGPMVVHCSAGVGRTGTFIAVDHLMQHVRTHDHLDIYNLVITMRNNRTNMVQTEDQYIFIHDCIKDYIRELEREDEDAEDGDVTDEPDYANAPVYANY